MKTTKPLLLTLAIVALVSLAYALASIDPSTHAGELAGSFNLMPLAFAGVVDMDSIKSLLQQQGAAIEEFKAHYEKKHKDLDDELVKLEMKMNRPGPTQGFTKGSGAMSSEAKKALDAMARHGDTTGLEVKSMRTSSDPDGGYLVPTEIDNEIENLLNEQSTFRQIATVKPVKTGEYKKIVNKGGVSSGWVGETEPRNETNTPDLAELAIVAREIYAKPKITQTLLDDASFDAAGWLMDEINEAFLLNEGEAFVSGDGIKKPRGILDYPVDSAADSTRAFGKLQFLDSGSASEVTPNSLITTPYKLRAGYRVGAKWLMNSATAATLMTMKDNQNRFLWIDGLKEGIPPTLSGYPVAIDENMPDIDGGAYPIAFGNFRRGYVITDRKQTTILRDPFTEKPYVIFYGTRRVGGAVVNFHAIKLLKIAA